MMDFCLQILMLQILIDLQYIWENDTVPYRVLVYLGDYAWLWAAFKQPAILGISD